MKMFAGPPGASAALPPPPPSWSRKHWYSVAASWNAAEAVRASPAFSRRMPKRKARSASPVAAEMEEDTRRDVAGRRPLRGRFLPVFGKKVEGS